MEKSKEIRLKEILPSLQKMCFNNEHTKVRLALATFFNAPKEIMDGYRAIREREIQNNYTSFSDIHERIKLTSKLNKHIKFNYGKTAYELAVSVQ
ncbi:MAG: hypothetical protein K2M17_05755 [Bacilli bacterium]|nr:hypothetical protein [Bacilli bacterium]